jgi:hypothetical protein
MENIGWIEALSLYEGKSTIFYGSRICTGAKASQNPGKPKRAVTVRRSVVDSASQSSLLVKAPVQRNIDKWFQTILAADPS